MTVADYTKDISAITKASPAVVTTSTVHGYATGDFVRITNCGLAGNFDYGMDEIKDRRYLITVIDTTSFSLKEPVIEEDIDSSGYSAYISDGKVNKIRTLYEIT